jgi:hypothetical protein
LLARRARQPSPPPLISLPHTRAQAGDAFATSKVASAVVRSCWVARAYKALNAHLLALCKRRGQLKQAIMDSVQLAMTYISQLEAKSDKEELIITIKTVTDGKIYAEVERARVTLALSALREAEGRISEASEILQECAVETFGSMERKEKTDMLLEQVRVLAVCVCVWAGGGSPSLFTPPPPTPLRRIISRDARRALPSSFPFLPPPFFRCACAWRSGILREWASLPTR